MLENKRFGLIQWFKQKQKWDRMISAKPSLLLRVSNNDLFFFFSQQEQAMFVQQMQCLFSGSSRNLLAMQISFPVSFCQNSKFCQISLSVVSCLSLFSVEFLLTMSFFGNGLANILQDSNAQILVFLWQVGRFSYIRLSTKYGLTRKFSCMSVSFNL